MWHYYEQMNDPASAYKYITTYIIENDSLQASNKALMTSDIDAMVKSLERQYQIDLLKKDKERDDIYLVIFVIAAIAAIVIILMVLRYSAKASRNVVTLTRLNDKVNEQKKRLEIALNELENRDKDKSRILRSVAHDVMSPIAAIAALADILSNESMGYTIDHQEILELIKDACNNSLRLSKDILEAAAAIAPGNMIKEWVDINKLVAGSVELLSVRAAGKKQQLVTNTGNNEIKAFVSKEKVWRVINNLIVNAIKFSYEGSKIYVDLKPENGNIIISVKDQGVGIPDKNKEHIFDMFTESKMHGTAGEKPHGLGLSISLQVARAHGGDIWFESEEDKGATFYFSFPQNLDA